MTKEQMLKGFEAGRELIQEEWSTAEEIKAADECIAENKAVLSENWTYKDGFQCERRIITGVVQ